MNTATDINYDSNLVKHAIRELNLIHEDQDVIDAFIRMISIFSDMNHSGASAFFATAQLERLLRFENLAPITDDPDQWNHIADDIAGQPDLWQCNRNSALFSNDGGKTYYNVEDPDRIRVNSEPAVKS